MSFYDETHLTVLNGQEKKDKWGWMFPQSNVYNYEMIHKALCVQRVCDSTRQLCHPESSIKSQMQKQDCIISQPFNANVFAANQHLISY